MSTATNTGRRTGIDSRLAGYATLAGVALALPAAAEAEIIFSGVVNINIPSTTAGFTSMW